MFNFLKDKDRTPPPLPEGTVRRRYTVSGRVPGVGLRHRARYAARQLGPTGGGGDEGDGTGTLEGQGGPARLGPALDGGAAGGYIQITGIQSRDIPPDPWARGFSVRGY